jgi:hypothetical protein
VSSVSFFGELQYQNVVINRENFNVVGSSSSVEHVFIDDTQYNHLSTNGYIDFELQGPRYITQFFLNIYSRSGIRILISEDFGATWVDVGIFIPPDRSKQLFILDRPYYATRIKITNPSSSYSVDLYYFALADSSVMQYKLSNGEVYQYDPDTDTWNKVYKIPLGYFYVWLNPDGTQNEIGHFIPTHVPQMSVAPYFTKTT